MFGRDAIKTHHRRQRHGPTEISYAARVRAVVALLVLATAAHADPIYDEIDQTDLPPRPAEDWWLRPIDRVIARVAAYDEDDRSYSTPARPRDLDGIVALSCERQEGRPCGHGAGFMTEVDTAAGYGGIAEAVVRLRATTGTAGYADAFALDRAYASATLGPAFVEAGRDVLAIGPRARTELAWSDHAPPLDQIRLQTARPYPLTRDLRAEALYVIGQLRDPAQHDPPLVTIARAQLDIAQRVEVALHQELAMGGDGAPSFGVGDFIAEHFRRRDSSAGPNDSSNRRFGGDIAVHLPGARVYYQLVFEDIRLHVWDALHYDADHLLGVELPWLVVELQRTGVRSYEHVPQRTAFTQDFRTVGSPLGPDTQSIYVAARAGVWAPWIELVRFASDTYTFVDHGPITQATSGPAELRYRTGARVRLPVTRELRAEADASYEHVSTFAFQPGTSRDNLGMMLVLVWQPGGFLPR